VPTFAMLLVPGMTQLDLTGPYEVFARCPGAQVSLVWKNREPVVSDQGLAILPTAACGEVDAPDVLFVPGGRGINALLTDAYLLGWLGGHARQAAYVTSVCTGALLLGAAGLLRGKRATTHWSAMHLLPLFGAEPVQERVVIDGKLVTGGGVTAGIDFALRLVAEMAGIEVAQSIQLDIEYNPYPPFDAGHPDRAPAAMVRAVRAQAEPRQNERREQVELAALRLRLSV